MGVAMGRAHFDFPPNWQCLAVFFVDMAVRAVLH